MDLQEILDNKVSAMRDERMKTSPQLTLGEITLKLESINLKDSDNEDKEIRFDFGYFKPTTLDSWRGSYAELAIGYSEQDKEVLAKDFLKECREAIGKTYKGYKGGDFTMGKVTPVWVSNYGECPNTAVVDIIDKGWWVLIKTEHLDY